MNIPHETSTIWSYCAPNPGYQPGWDSSCNQYCKKKSSISAAFLWFFHTLHHVIILDSKVITVVFSFDGRFSFSIIYSHQIYRDKKHLWKDKIVEQ